jgi:transcriptional regulator with XRE-family HTH domain
VNALQALITTRLDELHITQREAATRCKMAVSTLNNLLRTEHWSQPPKFETIEKLAEGLQIPASKVRKAAFEAAGLPYEEREAMIGGKRALLMASISGTGLTDDDIDDLLALAQAKERKHGKQERSERSERSAP